MTPTLTLRTARPQDLPDLRALHSANWRRDYAALLPASALARVLDSYMQRRWADLGPEKPRTNVVTEDDKLLGFIAFEDRDAAGVFVENLHVAAAARGRGIGRTLMTEAARMAGTRPVALEVIEGNTPARAIYRHWGGAEGPRKSATLLGHDLSERVVSWPTGAALLTVLSRPAP